MQNYRYPSSAVVTVTGIGSPNSAPIPSTSVLVAGKDLSGNLQPLLVDGSDNLKVAVQSSALPAGAATDAKQDTGNASLAALNAKLAASLVPTAFDYIALTYVPSGAGVGQIATAVYKTGGSAGTTVATLTLAYDGSDRLASVTKS